MAISTTRPSAAARSSGSARSIPIRRRPRPSPPRRPPAPPPCRSASTRAVRPTRTATSSTTRGISTAMVPTTTPRRSRPAARTTARARSWSGCGSPTRRGWLTPSRRRSRSARHPRWRSRRPPRARPTRSATASPSPATRRPRTARRSRSRGSTWTVDLHHCSALDPANCHVHHLQDVAGADSGTLVYPDHEYPSHITLTLTATAPSGLRGTASVRVDPKTVDLTFRTTVPGLRIAVGGEASPAPFTRRVAQGSTGRRRRAAEPVPRRPLVRLLVVVDGGAAAHQFTAPTTATTYTANYAEAVCTPPPGLVGRGASTSRR